MKNWYWCSSVVGVLECSGLRMRLCLVDFDLNQLELHDSRVSDKPKGLQGLRIMFLSRDVLGYHNRTKSTQF